MASVQKFKKAEVASQIRHVERTATGDNHINKKLLDRDYILSPDRGMDSYDYYMKRMSEVYSFRRKDVIVLIGWVVTAPSNITPNEYDRFFNIVYDFIQKKYGEKNIVTAAVHYDEEGLPHEHVLIIPVVPDNDAKHPQSERVRCKDVINRVELRRFHPELQAYLNQAGIHASILSGITARQGGNIRVHEYKNYRRREYEIDYGQEYEFHFGRD